MILFSLVPVIEKTGEVEDYVEYVTNTLLELKGLTTSIKALTFGIEWLIVDKFVTDEQTRNILCDALGDRMSLIHEYVRNKEIKAEDRMIRNFLRAGNSSQKIDSTPDVKIYTVIAGAFILTVFILLIILWKFRNRKARGNKNE